MKNVSLYRSAGIWGLALLLMAGCSGLQSKSEVQTTRTELLFERPSPAPGWPGKTPQATKKVVYFVGVSKRAATEQLARRDAMLNCISSVADYAGVKITRVGQYLASSFGRASDVFDPSEVTNERIDLYVNAFVKGVKDNEWYIQKLGAFTGKTLLEESWKAYVLATIPAEEIKRIQDYRPPPPLTLQAKRIKDDYYCVEVSSSEKTQVKDFRLMKNGVMVFPNPFAFSKKGRYTITEDSATLDFRKTGVIIIGDESDSFSIFLKNREKLNATYSLFGERYKADCTYND